MVASVVSLEVAHTLLEVAHAQEVTITTPGPMVAQVAVAVASPRFLVHSTIHVTTELVITIITTTTTSKHAHLQVHGNRLEKTSTVKQPMISLDGRFLCQLMGRLWPLERHITTILADKCKFLTL